MVICLERGADLHMAQLMPLPFTVSCSSKIQIGFTFLVPAHPSSPGQRAVKRVCVCVCVCVYLDSTRLTRFAFHRKHIASRAVVQIRLVIVRSTDSFICCLRVCALQNG